MYTRTLQRFVVTALALLFAASGVSFWASPELAARRFGIDAADASGLVAVRADFGGLFVGLALLCVGGAWLPGARAWLSAAAVMLLAIASGRAIGWMAGGSASVGSEELGKLGIELLGAAVLLAAGRESRPAVGRHIDHRVGSITFSPPNHRKEKAMNRFHLLTMILTVAMTLGTLASAHAGNVDYHYDEKADFASFESWTWKFPPQRQATTPTDRRIRLALQEGFTERGYVSADRGAVDFLVDFHTAGGRALPTPASFVGRRLRGDGHAKGVLVVDVFDAATGALVWRGSVSDAVGSGPLRADARAEAAVRLLLQKFPPPAVPPAPSSSPPPGS